MVLASGTLEPTEEYDVLHKYMGDNSTFMCKFSCDHVIPQDNFRAVVLSQFMGQSFDFRYGIRDSPKQLNTLSQLIVQVCQTSQSLEKEKEGGIVVFL